MRFHLTCLFLIIFQLLSAQTDQPLHFERIEGLSQNTVYSIIQDKQGFLWIATADGLNRYDGVEIKFFKPSLIYKEGEYAGRIIRSPLIEDEDDRIWFSSESGMFCFNKKQNNFIDLRKKLNGYPGMVWSLDPLLNEGHHLWGANGSVGLFNFNEQKGEWVNYDTRGLSKQPTVFTGRGVTNKQYFWFISQNGILEFDKTTLNWKQLINGIKSNALGYNNDTLYTSIGHEIYFSTIGKFKLQKIKIEEEYNKAATKTIGVFYTDKKDNIWAGDLEGNIYCKRQNSTVFKWRGNINSVNNTSGTLYPVYCLYVDDHDILWAGSDVLGLQRADLKQPRFYTYPATSEKLKPEELFIYSIYEDEKENIWLGTYTKGLILFNKSTRHARKIKHRSLNKINPGNNSVSLIREDSYGNLWMGFAGELFVKERNAVDFIPIQLPLAKISMQPSERFFSLCQFENDWLVTTNIGLYIVKKIKGKYTASFFEKAGQSNFHDLFIDSNKSIWLGHENGIWKIRDFYTYPANTDHLFTDTGVRSFLQDKEHHLLWISTSNGLIAYHLLTRKYKIFTEKDGLINSYVYGALQNDNDLWLSTNKGLSRASVSFKKDSLLPELHFTNYTSKDGLPDDEFNTGAFYKGRDNTFYFGSVKGVVWFDPKNLKPNNNLPRLVITELQVNETIADSTTAPGYIRQLDLPHFKNNLFFRFRGIELVDPSHVQYAYRLEGWDNNWIYSNTLNEVRYSNLPNGNYFFKIKASNGSGFWSNDIYSINIIIDPPWWRTWWFYTAISILIISSIIFITRYISQNRLKERIRQLEKQKAIEAERNRISKDMHDEIGSGLTRIALMTEMMNTKQELQETAKQKVNEIAGSTRELVETMSEIIWALNPRQDTLDSLLAYLREQTQHYFEPLNIHYKINFPDSVPNIDLSNEQRRNIFLVSKEALNNALKHSGATAIELSAHKINGQFEFSVTDNGKGINFSRPGTSGNGLKNMQQRMNDIKGGIEWLHQNSGGTRVNYWINI